MSTWKTLPFGTRRKSPKNAEQLRRSWNRRVCRSSPTNSQQLSDSLSSEIYVSAVLQPTKQPNDYTSLWLLHPASLCCIHLHKLESGLRHRSSEGIPSWYTTYQQRSQPRRWFSHCVFRLLLATPRRVIVVLLSFWLPEQMSTNVRYVDVINRHIDSTARINLADRRRRSWRRSKSMWHVCVCLQEKQKPVVQMLSPRQGRAVEWGLVWLEGSVICD